MTETAAIPAKTRRNPGICESCGGAVLAGLRGPIGRFCSRECRENRVPRHLACLHCGDPMTARRRTDQRFCSVRCRQRSRNRGPRPIPEHGTVSRYSNRGCRCASCTAAAVEAARMSRRRRAKPEQHTRDRRRAAKFGVEYERIEHQAVFTRDCWRCGICGGKVYRRLKHPHPRSATLDHIIPMATGGDHLYGNVQCSHRCCNMRKQKAGGGEQLLLDGSIGLQPPKRGRRLPNGTSSAA